MKRTRLGKLGAIVCALLSFVLIFSLAACGNKDQGDKGGNSLTLTTKTISVKEGGTATVSVTSATSEDVVWASTPATFATVKGSGAGNKLCTITGVAAGKATLTAKAGNKSATCTVTVTADSGEETLTIKLEDEAVSKLDIDKGDSMTLTAVASKGSAVSWSSDSEAVTVEDGVITAVSAGTAKIKASVSAELYAEVEVTVLEPITIGFNAGTPAGWSYWAGDSDANVSKCYYKPAAKEVHIVYTATYGTAYGVQIKFSNKYTGKTHDTDLVINAPAAGSVTVNDTNQVLVKGDNTISVEGSTGNALQINFGSEDNRTEEGNTYTDLFKGGADVPLEFVVKNISFASEAIELVAPSFAYDETEKTVAITDESNASDKVLRYELGFFASETATETSAVVTVTDGNAVDFTTVSEGTYVVKIRAVGGADAIDSDWSAEAEEIQVVNPNTPIGTETTEDWYYWTEGSVGNTYKDADGAVHINALNASANSYSFQLKKNLTAPITTIKMTVRAEGAGYLAFGPESGSVKEVQIAAGEDVEIELTGLDISGTLVICFGNNVSKWSGAELSCVSGDVVLSNIELS